MDRDDVVKTWAGRSYLRLQDEKDQALLRGSMEQHPSRDEGADVEKKSEELEEFERGSGLPWSASRSRHDGPVLEPGVLGVCAQCESGEHLCQRCRVSVTHGITHCCDCIILHELDAPHPVVANDPKLLGEYRRVISDLAAASGVSSKYAKRVIDQALCISHMVRTSGSGGREGSGASWVHKKMGAGS